MINGSSACRLLFCIASCFQTNIERELKKKGYHREKQRENRLPRLLAEAYNSTSI
jgi:broad-specificity NMP kinase